MRAGSCCVAALVLGICGVVLGWLPAVGRFVSLLCGLAACALGGVGMYLAPFGVRGSGHNLAVAGLALGVRVAVRRLARLRRGCARHGLHRSVHVVI